MFPNGLKNIKFEKNYVNFSFVSGEKKKKKVSLIQWEKNPIFLTLTIYEVNKVNVTS